DRPCSSYASSTLPQLFLPTRQPPRPTLFPYTTLFRSRLYLDVGSHPEYATAECDDLGQLVAHDKAGERILEDLLADAERRLADEGIGGDIFLFKNNTDSAGNSYGCHENYPVGRSGGFYRV